MPLSKNSEDIRCMIMSPRSYLPSSRTSSARNLATNTPLLVILWAVMVLSFVPLKIPENTFPLRPFHRFCAPMKCPWGEKCFTGYLGTNKKDWEQYDASVLAGSYAGPRLSILIDQGSQDEFLHKGQLLPEEFVAASLNNSSLDTNYRLQDGYDHSYFFISTFMKDHIE